MAIILRMYNSCPLYWKEVPKVPEVTEVPRVSRVLRVPGVLGVPKVESAVEAI